MQYAKNRQLASLKQRVPQAQPLTADESRWQVQLVTPQYQPICVIIIDLPAQFPNVKPSIRLSQTMRHPWVDGNGNIVGEPKLRNWSTYSDLGCIVSDIIREFARQPPTAIHGASGGASGAAPPSYDDQSPSTGKSRKERERASVPPCPDLSFIDKMSQDELEFYESNPEAVDDMILETAEAQSILTMSRDLLQKNEELATKILSKEEEAEAVQKKAHEKWAEMSLERDKLAGLLREQDELISRFDKTRIAEALAKEASELETGGDAMKRSFASLVGGGVKNATDIETFKRDFLQKRKEFHAVEARKEKLERV